MAVDRVSPAAAGGRVAVVTGTRAEFGLLEGTIGKLRDRGVPFDLVVAGMHLIPELGLTVREVEARFPVAARIPMPPPEDSPRGMAHAVAAGLRSFSDQFSLQRPALLLVLGDRTEAFAAALAAAYLQIPVAHIHGGDVSGNPIDDFQRDAISRLASLHFAATARSAERLRQLGVHGPVQVVGAPGLDAIRQRSLRARPEAARALGLPEEGWLVVLHHPNPVEAAAAAAEMAEVLEAASSLAAESRLAVAVIYPNNDAGWGGVVAEIRKLEGRPGVRTFKSLPRPDYLDLLAHARLLLGNSSSGIIESLSLGLPVVNIGSRQAGRERGANVIDAAAERGAILAAARRAWADPEVKKALQERKSPFGDGQAGERIAEAIVSYLRTVTR
ncbi:MAG: UDP-N-acetylglucosamine 2-epimerase (hydrolyzing) [Planctomycetes bacterium]|nr:UDP-N-acetylglucosamine 2-epimerase (hydrolyzing) [Planctomycetota bacterium]